MQKYVVRIRKISYTDGTVIHAPDRHDLSENASQLPFIKHKGGPYETRHIINMTNSADRYFHPEELVDERAELLGTRIRSCHIKDVHLSEPYTIRLEECDPGDGEFPLRYYVEKMHAIYPDMPVILEHLQTDEEYLRYLTYLKKELNGLH